jgi:hypothetical protein
MTMAHLHNIRLQKSVDVQIRSDAHRSASDRVDRLATQAEGIPVGPRPRTSLGRTYKSTEAAIDSPK